jgi:hypothetical protein
MNLFTNDTLIDVYRQINCIFTKQIKKKIILIFRLIDKAWGTVYQISQYLLIPSVHGEKQLTQAHYDASTIQF